SATSSRSAARRCRASLMTSDLLRPLRRASRRSSASVSGSSRTLVGMIALLYYRNVVQALPPGNPDYSSESPETRAAGRAEQHNRPEARCRSAHRARQRTPTQVNRQGMESADLSSTAAQPAEQNARMATVTVFGGTGF